MTDDNLRDRIAAAIMDSCHGVFTDDAVHAADGVIRELRPQLAAWARMCVDSGDMTPMAQRMLHKILGQA